MQKKERSYSERETELMRQVKELHGMVEKAFSYVDLDQKELCYKIRQAIIKYCPQHDGIYE